MTKEKQSPHQAGAVLFFTVLVIGSAMIVALATLSRAGVDTSLNAQTQEVAQKVREQLFGCVDELFIQLQADPNFSSLTIGTPDMTCSLMLTNLGENQREAELSITQANVTRSAIIELTVSPVSVINVQEE